MVDGGVVGAGDVLVSEGVFDGIGKAGEFGDRGMCEIVGVIVAQEKPIATVGHVAVYGATIG